MLANQKSKDKFSRYTDPTGQFTNHELRAGQWYVEHKLMLRNILIGVLAVWSIISVGYGIIGWGSYWLSGYFKDRDLARRGVTRFQNYAVTQVQYKATPLEFGALQVYSPTDGHFDFVTEAKNKNARFVVTLDYIFTYEGGQTTEQRAVIMPMSTLPVVALGQPSENYPTSAVLKIQKVSYNRVSPHQITNIKNYIADRTKFAVENVEFVPPQEGVFASRMKFDFINNTTHEFWDPLFYVEPLSGGQPLGIMSTTVPNFKPGEIRTIDLSTFIDITGADDIRVTPVFDVFDQSIYRRP